MTTLRLKDRDRTLIRVRINAAIDKADERARLSGPDKGYAFEDEYARNLSMLRGTYWHDRNRDDILSINHIAPVIETKHSLITAGNTEFLLRPRQERFSDHVEDAQGVLNDCWDALSLEQHADAAQWDTACYRFGVVEVGWRYEDGKRQMQGGRPDETELAEESLPETAMPMMVGGEFVAPYPAEEARLTLPSMPMMADEYGDMVPEQPEMLQEPTKPTVDDPFVERFKPRDFFSDPQGVRIDLMDARYAFRRKKVPLSEIKRNPNYRNTKDLKPDESEEWHKTDRDQKLPESLENELGLVTVFDYYGKHDIDGDGNPELIHVVMPKTQEKELLAEEFPYQFGSYANPYPFEVISAEIVDHDDEWNAVPDISRVRDLQVGHDESYSQLEWQRAHSPNVLLVPSGTFEGEDGQDTQRRIEDGKENAVLQVAGAFIQYVKWMDRPPLKMDAYKQLEEVPQKIRNALGVSEYQYNMVPEKSMTLGEANIQASQGSTRQESVTDDYYGLLSRIGYKLLCLLQQFAARRRPYSYQGEDGKPVWGDAGMTELRGPTATGEDIEEIGVQFAVEISPSKRLAQNRFMERKERLELLGTVAKLAELPDPRLPTRPLVDFAAIVQSVVDTYDLPAKYKAIHQPPTEEELAAYEQEKQAQQEQQMAAPALQAQAQNQQMSMQDKQHSDKMDLERDKLRMDALIKTMAMQNKPSGGNGRET